MDDAHTILLVEDDDATRTFLADNLTADGFDLLVADCVRDGRRLLETKFPDLAVVDVLLPDACGLDLVRTVRRADGIATRVDPNTPMLVLSGRGSELDRLRGFERGADDYVVKPSASVRRASAGRSSGRQSECIWGTSSAVRHSVPIAWLRKPSNASHASLPSGTYATFSNRSWSRRRSA